MGIITDTANSNNSYNNTAQTDDNYVFKKNNGQDVIYDTNGNDAIVLEGVNYSQVRACTLFCVSYLRHRWPRKRSSKCIVNQFIANLQF